MRNLDYRPTGFRLEWMQDSADDIAESSQYLSDIICETQPDVLHLNQFCYGSLDIDLPKIVVAHSDVVSWWVAVHGEEPPRSDWIDRYRDLVQAGLSGATTVVAPSCWMLAQVEKHYGYEHLGSVVYNGCDPRWFYPHGDKENLVLTVGRLWDAGKQISLLAGCDSAWPVVIAGETEHPDQAYREPTKRILCEGMLELKGKQTSEQLRTLYARAGIYVAPSRYEPFGLALVEAALSRCAIVASDIPSFRELWGETACYFDANDSSSLRGVIARLADDPDTRRRQAELAYQRARRRFSADRMVEEYLELYQALTAKRTIAA